MFRARTARPPGRSLRLFLPSFSFPTRHLFLRPKRQLITGDVLPLVSSLGHRDRADDAAAGPIPSHGVAQAELDEVAGLGFTHVLSKLGIGQAVDEGGSGPADRPRHLDAGSSEGDVVCGQN